MTKAFDEPDAESVACPAGEILDEGLDAIREHVSDVLRRERMLEVLRLYCAGKSLRHVETTVGCARATVSADLHAVQSWIGKSFMRGGTDRIDVKSAMARVSRIDRETGQRAASVLDWHALRATWVTLALSAGVPVELVRRVTGHATVEVVLKHYFRPDREQFRAALTGALPVVLTGRVRGQLTVDSGQKGGEGETGDGGKRQEGSGKGGDMVALAGKVAAGTATKAEMGRLRELLER